MLGFSRCNLGEKSLIFYFYFLKKMQLMTLNAAAAFSSPVDLSAFPNYIVVNPNLVDLLFVRNRLDNLFYR